MGRLVIRPFVAAVISIDATNSQANYLAQITGQENGIWKTNRAETAKVALRCAN